VEQLWVVDSGRTVKFERDLMAAMNLQKWNVEDGVWKLKTAEFGRLKDVIGSG